MTVDQILDTIWKRKVPFAIVFFVVVTITYGTLYALDFYPEPPAEEDTIEPTDTMAHTTAAAGTSTPDSEMVEPPRDPAPEPTEPLLPASEAEPVSIYIDALAKEVPVRNPVSRDVADLDAALLHGVVRHPDSADFREPGTMFILGHSSYLPVVNNKHFQAFNGIQNLEWGDTIRVRSSAREYTYRVDTVYEAKASDAYIPLQWEEAKLVLATCDSFGSVEDRFMVEATLVDTVLLTEATEETV